MSTTDLSPTVLPKKPRDTTNRLDVRMHKTTTFLAFAFRGNLWEFFPRGTFYYNASKPTRTLLVKWCEPKTVRPLLFGLLAYRKTPYRPSKGEQ